jgi:uncharacterized membrane protein
MCISKAFKHLKNNIFLVGLVIFSTGIFFVNLRINTFRYNNFDYGKFDLGNMTQMLWNTLHGRLLYLTDYFGTNLPRWAMSHVDPILLLFVPVFALFQHPATLIISQLVLVIFSSILIYLIANLELDSKLAASILGLSYLVYPAVGFLTAWTGFHGVSVVIPAFLGAFYMFERMHKKNIFTKKGLILFWILLILTMMGKEQLPLYVFMYGGFVWLLRNKKNLGIRMMLVSFLWFVMAFFVVIPAYSHLRAEGYVRFAESLGLDTSITSDVARPNYFLSRYDDFGESYGEVIFNMILSPDKVIRVFFGGDNMDNLRMTFEPLGYLPLVYPAIFVFAVPDFLINYLTTAGGIGTAEIYNHRISMIVPVLFVSTIYAISWLSIKRLKKICPVVLSGIVLILSVYTTFEYNNPVYLWLTQAVQKRIAGGVAYAKYDHGVVQMGDLEVGNVLKLSPLENKDRECAQRVVDMIPNDASVSGPDYLGAHLAMRETYAIFPALYKEADYVIVDVFSRKILTILDVDISLMRGVVGDIMRDENYKLEVGCGNLFVFKKVGVHKKETKLPLQERFAYNEKTNLEIFKSLTVVDYTLADTIYRGEPSQLQIVYIKRENDSLDAYFLFTTFVNAATGEMYQVANLPSFGVTQLRAWTEDHYYVEDLELMLPAYLDAGSYKVFVGMSNVIRTRSMYLGEVEVL